MRRDHNGDSSFWDDPDEDPRSGLTRSARQSNGTAADHSAERNSADTNGISAAGDRLAGPSSSQQERPSNFTVRSEESVPLRHGELSTEDEHKSPRIHTMEVELPASTATREFRNVFMKQRTKARWSTSICLNFAMVFERADEVILPAMYNFVAQSFQATPTQLAIITLSRALVQALASPLGGLLGHWYNRIYVITCGCIIWGLMTLGFSLSRNLIMAICFWAINGLGLALVIPNVQSVTADFYEEEHRGRAFGTLHLTSAAGAAFGGLYATNMGASHLTQYEGWRLAFAILGFVSLAIGLANFVFSKDPRSFDGHPPSATQHGRQNGMRMFMAALKDVKSVVTVPTFAIIIVQGIIGNIPGQALAFLTLYLQLLEVSNFKASLLVSLMMLAHAVGGQLGGWLGDVAAQRLPNAGRVIVCQVSVVAGAILTGIILKGLPHQNASSFFAVYVTVFMLNGALNAWPAPACNNPIFAEIVPARLRTFIYAFDRSFEMAVAACAAPVVGKLAESAFGFEGTAATTGDVGHDLRKAASLSSAMLVMTAVPWALCCLAYSGLYWTYPRDKGKAITSEGFSDVQRGRLVERNGFLRFEEGGEGGEEGSSTEGFAQKWQLLRTRPADKLPM
ncbi:g8015 [Coccomyxa elongata]